MKTEEKNIKKAVLTADINAKLAEMRRNGLMEAEIQKRNRELENQIKMNFREIEEVENKYQQYCYENNLGEFSEEANKLKIEE